MDRDKIVSLECPDYPGYIIAHSDIEYVEVHEEHNVVSRLIFDLRDVECRIITYSYWNTVPYIVLQQCQFHSIHDRETNLTGQSHKEDYESRHQIACPSRR